MTDETRRRAEDIRTEIETVTSAPLPQPSADPLSIRDADPQLAAEIRRRMAEIDLADTGSIVRFGTRAQAGLQEISQKMLADVKSKEVGPAGESLRSIVTTIRGFSTSELDVRRTRSWWEKLLGRSAPFAKFVANYEQVQTQIDRITVELERHEQTLLKDIKSLDLLYDHTLNFYDELALYIAAGEEKLAELDGTAIPRLEAQVKDAPEDQQVLQAQALRDLRAGR
ncbi:toxic anion resistance protein, partial [uncultured Paracoccus sp.]|uniref:toxic anion resistance protein n=1 Tax=uncultured Paracoccus sp. TaxID=189685 RepID=UPI0025F05077